MLVRVMVNFLNYQLNQTLLRSPLRPSGKGSEGGNECGSLLSSLHRLHSVDAYTNISPELGIRVAIRCLIVRQNITPGRIRQVVSFPTTHILPTDVLSGIPRAK